MRTENILPIFGKQRELSIEEISQMLEYAQGQGDEVLKLKGYSLAVAEIISFLNPYYKPFLLDEARETYFFDRIKKIKARYIDPI